MLLAFTALVHYRPYRLIEHYSAERLLSLISSKLASAEISVRYLGFNATVKFEVRISNIYVGYRLKLTSNGELCLIFGDQIYSISLPRGPDVHYVSSEFLIVEPRVVVRARNLDGKIVVELTGS